MLRPDARAVTLPPRSGRCAASWRTDFPNIDVLTRDEFRDDQQEQVDQFLTVLIAILALSEIIAILGIVNTLVLSVYERTRELGLLRVVGMSRRQMRRMVRWESVVIAVLGGARGTRARAAVGLGVRARAARSRASTVFSIPVVEVLLFVGGSMLAGRAGRRAAGVASVAPRRARGHRHGMTKGCYHDRLTGRLAQGESTSLTRKGSAVQICYRPR